MPFGTSESPSDLLAFGTSTRAKNEQTKGQSMKGLDHSLQVDKK